MANLTLSLLTWKIWWAPNNASKWQMGFNFAFKGFKKSYCIFATMSWRMKSFTTKNKLKIKCKVVMFFHFAFVVNSKSWLLLPQWCSKTIITLVQPPMSEILKPSQTSPTDSILTWQYIATVSVYSQDFHNRYLTCYKKMSNVNCY
jgi:hypothetical protein